MGQSRGRHPGAWMERSGSVWAAVRNQAADPLVWRGPCSRYEGVALQTRTRRQGKRARGVRRIRGGRASRIRTVSSSQGKEHRHESSCISRSALHGQRGGSPLWPVCMLHTHRYRDHAMGSAGKPGCCHGLGRGSRGGPAGGPTGRQGRDHGSGGPQGRSDPEGGVHRGIHRPRRNRPGRRGSLKIRQTAACQGQLATDSAGIRRPRSTHGHGTRAGWGVRHGIWPGSRPGSRHGRRQKPLMTHPFTTRECERPGATIGPGSTPRGRSPAHFTFSTRSRAAD